MTAFVSYSFGEWPEGFTEALNGSPGHALALRADASGESPSVSWLVRTGPGRLTVEGGPGTALDGSVRPDVTVSGAPAAVLRWAWNREVPGGVARPG